MEAVNTICDINFYLLASIHYMGQFIIGKTRPLT